MPTVRNPVLESWFYRALALKLGEELFIPCEDRKERRKMVKQLDDLLKRYTHIEPVVTSQLVFRESFRDAAHWVRVIRKPNKPEVVFTKHTDGSVTKETLAQNFEMKRMVELMSQDGWSKDHIREHFDNISDDELEIYLKEV